MAKLTLTALATLIKGYVQAGLIEIPKGDYVANREVVSQLIVKIGKQLMLDSDFSDRLPELDAETLPFGTTIEEYFVNLTMPENHDMDGTDNMKPVRLVFEDPYYSKELGKKTFGVTIDDDQLKRAMLGESEFAGVMAVQMKRLWDSYTVYKFGLKRQLIGVAIENLTVGSAQIVTTPKPVDTATGEAFTKLVKEYNTLLTEYETEDYNKGGVVAISPDVFLYVKGPKIIPTLDVDVLAGAFQVEKAQIPVKLKSLKDFGELTNFPKAYAVLVDTRGIALHPTSLSSTSDRNGKGEFTNYWLHANFTAFVSHFTNIVVFTEA